MPNTMPPSSNPSVRMGSALSPASPGRTTAPLTGYLEFTGRSFLPTPPLSAADSGWPSRRVSSVRCCGWNNRRTRDIAGEARRWGEAQGRKSK
jgi:hypothetical protein